MALQRNGHRYQLNSTADMQNHHVYYQIWWNFSIKAISLESLNPAYKWGIYLNLKVKWQHYVADKNPKE